MEIVRHIESMDRFMISSQSCAISHAASADNSRAMAMSIIASARSAKLAMDDASLANEKVQASISNGLQPPSTHVHSGMT
eukprot:6415888-Pyramimonas_sp.AAC.1